MFKKNYANCFYASWFFSSTRMCHPTKEIKCDMQDDEYFESHYKVSQGFLRSGDEEECFNNVVETLLYSKCQKDPLSTVSKFCYLLILKYSFHSVLSYKCFLNSKN